MDISLSAAKLRLAVTTRLLTFIQGVSNAQSAYAQSTGVGEAQLPQLAEALAAECSKLLADMKAFIKELSVTALKSQPKPQRLSPELTRALAWPKPTAVPAGGKPVSPSTLVVPQPAVSGAHQATGSMRPRAAQRSRVRREQATGGVERRTSKNQGRKES